jgi:hypothetical protein
MSKSKQDETLPPAASTDPEPAASRAKIRPTKITVEVVAADVVHPLTGAPVALGEHLTVQANFADVLVRVRKAKYLRVEDHPRVRSGAVKLDPAKG